MSIVLIFNKNDPAPWRERLLAKLPEVKIEIHPDVKDKRSIRFALCWKPDPEILQQYQNIEVVQSMGAGVDHILDTQTLTTKIKLTRIVDHNLSHDMWEFLLAAVLQHIKNFPVYHQYQLKNKWRPRHYKTIQDTHVSIMGLGQIGEYVAKKFCAMGFKISGWSTSKKSISGITAFSNDELELFLNDTDILINLLPLTPDTKGILNQELFNKLKKRAYLINVGRGEHLVEGDLLNALDTEQVSGALLDVFAEEPLPESHSFWSNTKITVTPHIASLTNFDSATELIAENYLRMIGGKELLHEVSLAKGY